jgi:type IV pilus assembly protein PilM
MGIFSNILKSTQVTDTTNVIGVDVGTSSIKVVELEERKGVITLTTYGEVQLGPYAGKSLGAVVHLDPKQQQEALVDVVRESAVKSRNAVFAMPLSASFISTSVLQADPTADLSATVRIEARKLIPASLSEVTLDWAELEPLSDNQTGRPVLIAAIQNTAIDRFNVLMQFAGFAGAPTEIECFSTNRTIAKKDHTVILDVGATTSKMYMSHNGVLVRMHRVNAGGAEVTAYLVETLSVSFAEAEKIKLQAVSSNSEHYVAVQQAYTKIFSRSLREFRQVIDHYQKDSEISFTHISVCGGASLFSGFASQFQETLGLPVEFIDPFKNVAYPAFMEDAMMQIGPLFVPALGAALRNFE